MTQSAPSIRVTVGSTTWHNVPGSTHHFTRSSSPGPDSYSVGAMTQALYTWEGRRSEDRPDVLDLVHYDFLNLELEGRRLDATGLEDIARNLTLHASERLEELSMHLFPKEIDAIRRISRKNRIPFRLAKIEYVANACLFRLVRDQHKLPKMQEGTSIGYNSRCGFFALTDRGSLISSPPPQSNNSRRTFHYRKIELRNNPVDTGTYQGILTGDVRRNMPVSFIPDEPLIKTEFDNTNIKTFGTSRVRFLVKIPENDSHVFETIRKNLELASDIIHQTLTGIA